jgi:hypothetical protein
MVSSHPGRPFIRSDRYRRRMLRLHGHPFTITRFILAALQFVASVIVILFWVLHAKAENAWTGACFLRRELTTALISYPLFCV